MESFRKAVGSRETSPPPEESADADASVPAGPTDLFGEMPRLPTLKEAEEQLVAEALARARNNQGIAASLLGITRQALNKRLVRGSRAGKGGDSPGE
jgi:DNA-binding NtrC family response regulator